MLLKTRHDNRLEVRVTATTIVNPAGVSRLIALLFEDVGEPRRAEEIRARLAAIVESSDDAIVGKTLDGTVISWNRGAERIFGYSADEMVGRPIAALVPPDRPDDLKTILGAIRRGERVEHFETERIRKDGTRIHVSLAVSPIKDSKGKIIGASKIARDVSDRKRADAERDALLELAQQARAEAEAANRTKDNFLAMLSHELRNPLAAIRNAIVTARLDDNRREAALTIARRQAEQLGRLVDDLLDVSRITKGRVLLKKAPLYFSEIIDRAVDSARPFVDGRGHRLSVALVDDAVRVEADATRLEQVVVNLIVNAAKYTDPGGRIELFLERDKRDAVLRVRDNGIGISADMLPRIFDLFSQAERGLDRAQGGLGIGLTVVRSLVELHGGRIQATSDGVGQGAEFIVRIPAVGAGVAESATSVAQEVGTKRSSSARILLVEDNIDVAESLLMLLEVLGHDVAVAHDGPSALEIAAGDPPDVMLIDIGLPEMDGYEVARRARRHPALSSILLVALTGYGRDDDREQALKAGFDHHLVKPVDPKILQTLVARAGAESPEERTLN
jgi:PAS domain S-box-containing protein